jgi:hypothetical protein
VIAVARTILAAGLLASAVGCQQKMAEQPAPRPYEQSAMFAHGQSARPLEKGVVHRNQRLDSDPLVNWLTPEGRKAKDEIKLADKVNSVVPQAGAPTKKDYFVAELPFAPTAADLRRGQTLYNSNCALCHGAAGWGNGKIAERGFLRPPSYHTDPAGKAGDWSTLDQPSDSGQGGVLPMGYSRGFYRWGEKIALKDVPVGYVFQVITWGFGGMGSHDTQIPDPVDRWRVTAYVRTLQLSQAGLPAGDLPADVVAALNTKTTPTGHEGAHK